MAAKTTAKTTYVATAPSGEQFTRKSHRTYTHAVLTFGHDWYTRKNGLGPRWGVLAFCGRHDLAVKRANQERAWLAANEPDSQVLIVELTTR